MESPFDVARIQEVFRNESIPLTLFAHPAFHLAHRGTNTGLSSEHYGEFRDVLPRFSRFGELQHEEDSENGGRGERGMEKMVTQRVVVDKMGDRLPGGPLDVENVEGEDGDEGRTTAVCKFRSIRSLLDEL